MIRLRDIHLEARVGDQDVHILRGIDLEIQPGETLSIMGPSGSGKSSLLHILGLLTPMTRGEYWVDDWRVNVRARRRYLDYRASIGFVFQDAKLIPDLNVMDNVCVPLAHRGLWPTRQRRLAGEVLEQVGLEHRLRHFPRQLSGGETLRAAIARALVARPRLLLADEPTGSLDTHTGEQITRLLLNTVDRERALVIVTHHPPLAAQAERTVHLCDGAVEGLRHNRCEP